MKGGLSYVCDNQRHLICVPYSIDNLHEMARQLGLARDWFHGGKHPHYDLPKGRIAEITKRCVVVSPREIVRTIEAALLPLLKAALPDPDGWTPHHGGMCPFLAGERVELRLRNGQHRGPAAADAYGGWHWAADKRAFGDFNIVAFREVR